MTFRFKKQYAYLVGGICVVCVSAFAADHLQQNQVVSPSPSPSVSPSASPSASPSVTPSASPAPVLTTSRQVFTAALTPVNPGYSSASGNAVFVVDGNNLGVYLQAAGLDPGMQHQQYLQVGSACPDLNADTNGDGIIDSAEEEAITSPPTVALAISQLVALGGVPFPTPTASASASPTPTASASASPTPSASTAAALSAAQVAGTVASTLVYPIPAQDGVVTYIGSGALASLIPASLAGNAAAAGQSGVTPNTTALPNLVVSIRGIDPSIQLPDTVAATEGGTPNQSLPVACGVLTPVTE